MLLSRQLAGFTRGQSDTLRKAMGKKKIKDMEKLEVLFYEGGQKNGHDKKVLNKIWEDWKKFASYAFNKSHATCYSWVSYQTAYLKAHYPAEYMAAVMSRNLNNITEVTKLMDECRVMNIPTLGPDVNESRQKFAANKSGVIRFGLAAIKGLGGAAADAIISERDENGPYKSVFDLVQRINLQTCNRRALESLALSGGLDCFGIRREQYFATDNKGNSFLDAIMKYGYLYQQEQQQSARSLFGDFDSIEIATPPVPQQYEQWSDIERLNRERDLIGIYISAHPLDEFSVILRHMCNTRCSELAKEEVLNERGNITFGGIVTNVRSAFTRKGVPCGFVTIEDFDGSGELRLFGEDWAANQGMLMPNSTVFVHASMVQRFRDSNTKSLRVKSIQYLQTVQEKNIERFTITMGTGHVDDAIVNELAIAIADHSGPVPLYMQFRDSETNALVTLRARGHGVHVGHELINFLDSYKDIMSYQVN